MDSVTVPTSALRSDVLWILKVISSHYSLRSCLGLKELFEVVFFDSEIAKLFKLSKTKCSYFINFELAPYFKDLLVKEVKAANISVFCLTIVWTRFCKRNRWMYRLDIGMKLPSKLMLDFLTPNFWNSQMQRISLIV